MVGIVKLALRRPYTFIVMALLIMIFGVASALRTPVDIFPNINIPVISVVFSYTGLSPDDMQGRVVTFYERSLTTSVNDIEHIESQSIPNYGIVKIFFQPTVNINAALARGDAEQSLILPGNIQPYYKSAIYARVSGYLKSWQQDIGAHVKAGQVLASIDAPDVDQQLAQAKAALASAQANAQLAAVTAQRWAILLKTQVVSQQAADNYASDAAAKKATADAAQANVRQLEAMETFKTIVAPFDGVVTQRNTDVGALINAGKSTGQELFEVSDLHRVRIYVQVPQALTAQLHPGLKATFELPQYPSRKFDATLVTTSNAIDAASHSMQVELQANNPDGALVGGTYCRVQFHIPGDPNMVRIPAMLGRSSLGRDFCGILAATLLSVAAIGFAVRTGQDEAVSAYSTGNCGDTEVFVMVKIHRRGSDRRGEAVGYSVGVRTIGTFISAIYDVDESRYQRWRGNGSADFDPLPPADLGLETRVFELPGRTYNRDSPSRESPPLMNIFFDPQQFSHDQFTALSDCFEKNERELNRVLAQLGSSFKWSAAGTYFPLRLGGIVYGLPPYADRRYLAAIHAIWGLADPPPPVVTLPASGLLTILPGQRAEGRVGGASFDIGVYEGPRPGFLTHTSRVTINNIVIAPVSRHNDDSITYSLVPINEPSNR